jgi:hypothetical protein
MNRPLANGLREAKEMKSTLVATTALTLVLTWMGAAWAEEGGQWHGKAVLVNTQIMTSSVGDDQDHALMMGDDRGLIFNEDGESFSTRPNITCIGWSTLEAWSGVAIRP